MTSPLDTISAAVPPMSIGPRLGEQLERQVLAPARSIGVDLPLVAVTDPLPPVEVKRSPRGTWWVAATFEANPAALANGGVTKAPPQVIEELRRLRTAGVAIDYVYVLDELPGTWMPGTPPPPMRLAGAESAGVATVKTQEAIFAAGLEGLRAVVKGAGAAARGAIAAGAMAGAAAAVAGAVVAGTIAYDPVVLGGVKDSESDRIAWFSLAAWDEVPR